jgi:hypothetical protein
MLSEIRKRKFCLGDILSGSWTVFKEHFKTVFLILLIVNVPIFIVESMIPDDESALEEGESGLLKMLGSSIISYASYAITVLATMGIAFVIEGALEGKKIPYDLALKRSLSRWVAVMLTGILAWLILLGLTLLFIVPGIIWAVYYTFYVLVVALRGKIGKPALNYSKSIVKGQWWWVFWVTLVLGILHLFILGFIALPFLLLAPRSLISQIIATPLGLIVSGFYTVTLVIFFLNLDYLKNAEIPAESIQT